MQSIVFTIEGRPIPKPRMTTKDKFVDRKATELYRCYKSEITASYINTCSKLFRRLLKFNTAAMQMDFFVSGTLTARDVSNTVKSIEEALIGYAFIDDSMKYLRGYDRVWVYNTCLSCANNKNCAGIKSCKNQKAVIKIREVEEKELVYGNI